MILLKNIKEPQGSYLDLYPKYIYISLVDQRSTYHFHSEKNKICGIDVPYNLELTWLTLVDFDSILIQFYDDTTRYLLNKQEFNY